MTEPHTADLATRARYREEGRQLEQDRIIELINRFCEGRHSWGDYCTCPDLVQELKGNE